MRKFKIGDKVKFINDEQALIGATYPPGSSGLTGTVTNDTYHFRGFDAYTVKMNAWPKGNTNPTWIAWDAVLEPPNHSYCQSTKTHTKSQTSTFDKYDPAYWYDEIWD